MILPHHIDLAQSQKYDLSIRLTPNGFSFSITSATNSAVFYFKEIDFNNNLSFVENVKKVFFEVNLFTQHYRKTDVTVVSPFYTLVPENYFETTRAADFFTFNINQEKEQILHNPAFHNSFHIVYNLNRELYSFLHRNLWNPAFNFFTNHLLNYFRDHRSDTAVKRSFVDFHDNLISVLCFDGDKLLSVNTLPNTGSSNTLYFIASIWEQLPLDQLKDQLFISGKTEPQREVIDTLKKLIKNVSFTEITPKLALTEEQKKSVPTDLLVQL